MTKQVFVPRPEASRIAHALVSHCERSASPCETLRLDGRDQRTRTHRHVRRLDFEDALQPNQPARKWVASRSASVCFGSTGRGLSERDVFGAWTPTAPPVRPSLQIHIHRFLRRRCATACPGWEATAFCHLERWDWARRPRLNRSLSDSGRFSLRPALVATTFGFPRSVVFRPAGRFGMNAKFDCLRETEECCFDLL